MRSNNSRSYWDNLGSSYDNLWKAFIRPPRQTYTEWDLGDNEFYIEEYKLQVIRKDKKLFNDRK